MSIDRVLSISDTQAHADAMAKAVQVTYTDMKPPILTIQDAISAESFHPNVQEVVKGDPKGIVHLDSLGIIWVVVRFYDYVRFCYPSADLRIQIFW